jgi:hypothetical protein
MLRCASHKNKPLRAMDNTANAIHKKRFVVVWDNLNPKGHPISKIPAIKR